MTRARRQPPPIPERAVRPNALLCIDPAYAGPTGLAYFECGIGGFVLSKYGILTPEEVRDGGDGCVEARTYWIRKAIKDGGSLVIEDAHFRHNILTTKRMVEAKCYWTVAAVDAGLPAAQILEVQPQQWLSLVQRGWRFGTLSDKRIGVIQHYVRHRWGVMEDSPDALSAICLGTWAIDTQGWR